MEERGPPSSHGGDTEGAAWMVDLPAAAQPRQGLIRRAWRAGGRVRLRLLSAIVMTLLLLAFGVGSASALALDRSMDFPGGEPRLGLRGISWFSRWVCDDGHTHLSAPFWFAGLPMLLACWWLWRATRRAVAVVASV